MSRNLVCLLVLSVIGLVSCTFERTGSSRLNDSGQARQGALITNSVEDAVRAFTNSVSCGGLALGVVRNGTVYCFGFGEMEKGTGRRPTASTLYAIGSVTKTFTATLLAQAVVEGRMKLEDDVRKYLDGSFPNLEYETHPIRVAHLVNHNSGLPFSMKEAAVAKDVSPGTHRQDWNAFESALARVRLQSVPGSRFQYSNAAAQLLGYILERVYGQSYEQLMRTRIATPLGMNHTKSTLTRLEQASLKGYDEHGALVTVQSENMPAAGGLKSTVADLLKYLQWHLAERDPAATLTHQPAWKLGERYSLGLNWQMFSLPGYRYIWQEGSIPGFSSYCVFCPELDLAVVALVNQLDRSSADRVSTMVKQIVKGVDSRAADLP